MTNQAIIEEIMKKSVRLDSYDDLDILIEAIGDANYVLLGEASHGTSEFYTMRAELSKRLIEQKGFSFIAVEGTGLPATGSIAISSNMTGARRTPGRSCAAIFAVGLRGCGRMKRQPS